MIQRAFLAIVAAAAVLGGGAVSAADLVSHRATYAMKLVKSDAAAAVTDARGAMVYEFRDTCDGWSTDSKVYLLMRIGGGPEVESVRDMTTWEGKNGEGFRFRLTEREGGKAEHVIKGVAISGPKGGTVEYSEPRTVTLDLPKNTLFPTAHLLQMIAAAQGGARHLSRTLFDGATLKNPYVVSAAISPGAGAPPHVIGEPAMLAGVKWWSARLAYFPTRAAAETPEFELDVDYSADGVVRLVTQDYGDYVIRATLNEIERLPPPTC